MKSGALALVPAANAVRGTKLRLLPQPGRNMWYDAMEADALIQAVALGVLTDPDSDEGGEHAEHWRGVGAARRRVRLTADVDDDDAAPGCQPPLPLPIAITDPRLTTPQRCALATTL